MGFQFDALKHSYSSRRSVVYGRKGMVATSQPLAAQAGLDMIKKGGNAIDAAIATAACLTVMEPTGCGIGGDSFALVWVKDQLFGMNGSGYAPGLCTAEAVKAEGHTAMPRYGWLPVTVPGIPSGWAELSARFGKLPFSELLAPAIGYARDGYPVSPIIARLWKKGIDTYRQSVSGAAHEPFFATYAKDGKIPQAGELVRLEDHARTLQELADTKCESFYRGALAEKIDAFARETGGLLRKEDLAGFRAEWVEPIKTNYKGYDVWEIPPNGHGIVALMALNILNGYDFSHRENADAFHKQFEAMKLAFVDGQRYVADPKYMRVSVSDMLSEEYADKRRALIGETALMPEAGDPSCGGTVYLCTADGEGNMVSYIQSNYYGFGSGVVVPDTGIALHNRGYNFSLEEGMENCVAPHKKPYHTIIPAFLSKDGKAVGPFGVMGGFMQPQGHLQVVMNTVDFGMNPQEALDAPRWQWTGGKNIEVERTFPIAITEELVRKGHAITVPAESLLFGRGQIIWRDEDGVLAGGSEPRTDGFVAAW